MSWPDRIQRALCAVSEQDGQIHTRYVGLVRDPVTSQVHLSKFRGLLSLQGDRLILLERDRGISDSVTQTILMPPERHSASYVTGLAFMMAWRPERAPFSSLIIWKRLPVSTDYRRALGQCGLISRHSRSLDPVIRSFFDGATQAFLSL
jgi:hypothetical protein